MATTATAIATKPLRTRKELAGGDAPLVYRPRISAIKVVERRLATYFRSQIRSARMALSVLDGDDLSDLSPKQIDKLLEKLVGKVKASENSERMLRRSLVGIYEGMAGAAHRRGLKQAKSAARKLKRAGKTIRKAQPLELSKQLINATEWARMHAGELITDTDDVTKSWVMRAIRKGIEEGQSIQQMEDRLIWIRASWAKRQPGKQSRAEKIARTETGMAYNMGSLIGYRDSEVVEFVNVYDNKAPGSCVACAEADGQVWTVPYAMDHLLEHPNCIRAFGAVIAEAEPVPEPVPEPEPISDKGKPETVHDTPVELRGATDSYMAEWADGSKAIFKPGKADQPRRAAIYTDEDSEVAAYRLAELLGYDAVPETDYVTYVAKGKSVFGSAQRWIENTHVGYRMSLEDMKKPRAIAQRTVMALFDQVIVNPDRHGGNFLEDDDGKLWAIDHGHTFMPGYAPDLEEVQALGVFGMESRIVEITGWRDIPPIQLEVMSETLARWSKFSYKDIEKVMLKYNKSKGDVRRVYERIQTLNLEMQRVLRELGR